MNQARFYVVLLVQLLGFLGVAYFLRPAPASPSVGASCAPSALGAGGGVSAPAANASRLKTIVLWTPYFGSPTWDYEALGTAPFEHELCRHRCLATADRGATGAADAVLFHYSDVARGGRWPRELPPSAVAVLVVHEPPSVVKDAMRGLDGKVHLVMSHRPDSDIYAPYRVPWPRPVADPGPYRPAVRLTERPKSVVWLVSNCQTASRREKYVAELAKYIDVDVYGACGTMSCPKHEWHRCMGTLVKTYKFYLSFEKEICPGYVTEKFYEPLRYDIVPVVLGEADDFLAPKFGGRPAYVNVRNFRSPEALADHLRSVGGDQALYDEYLQWKTRYRILSTHGPLTMGFCKLCDWLNERDERVTREYRRDVTEWWYGSQCDNDLVAKQLKKA